MEFGTLFWSHVLYLALLVSQGFCVEFKTPQQWRSAIRGARLELQEAIQEMYTLTRTTLHARDPGDSERNAALMVSLNKSIVALDVELVEFGLRSFGGGMYIRWGREDCPKDTDRMYIGQAGGGHSVESGSPAEYQCIPEIPDYLSRNLPRFNAMLWGSKYMTFNSILPQVHTMKVPCALCRSTHRRSAFMVPGWSDCNQARTVNAVPWHFQTEYAGYLMSGKSDHNAASSYVCLDSQPQFINLSRAEFYPKLLYFTVSRCGALECPPYEDYRVVPCVVCSM